MKRILVLCTGNLARSQMAEGFLRSFDAGLEVHSAGTRPAERVHPAAVQAMAEVGIDIGAGRPKSVEQYLGQRFDFVITVCDKAAGEVCPFWPGQPVTAHWGFPDPAAVGGTDEQKRAAFTRIFHQMRNRVQLFLSLPLETLDRMSLERRVRAIGQEPL